MSFPHPDPAFVRVLVVEDDEPLRALIARGLAEDGHVIDTLPDGRECDAYLAATPYDALVLDLNLPHEDGLSILRRLRARGEATPVLLLTARDAADDVVAGLNAGADDYLRKPFAFIELEARLRSIARRPPTWSGDVLQASDLTFDCSTRQARRGERDLDLTAKEAVFLEVLLRNRGRTVPRACSKICFGTGTAIPPRTCSTFTRGAYATNSSPKANRS